VIAFRALPLILVVSALSSLLFYWRVLPFIVRGLSRLLEETLGIGGAVGLSAAADVFVGMVEAPLLVRPYLGALSRGEPFSIMSCGMATIAGTVMVLYGSILGEVLPDAMGHILTASLINTPGALLIAAIMVPVECAIAGVALLINIIALLIVFVALVSLADTILGLLPHFGGELVTLRRILGLLMVPLVARRDPLGRGPGGRGAHGDQDGAERVGRLPRPRAVAEG
jgi:concentrative nucleoside transporter, CNT family